MNELAIEIETAPHAINFERDDYSVLQFNIPMGEVEEPKVALTDLSLKRLLVCYPSGQWQVFGEQPVTMESGLGQVRSLTVVNDQQVMVNLPNGDIHQLDLSNNNISKLSFTGKLTSAFTLSEQVLVVTLKNDGLRICDRTHLHESTRFQFFLNCSKDSIRCADNVTPLEGEQLLSLRSSSKNIDGALLLTAINCDNDVINFLFDFKKGSTCALTIFREAANSVDVNKLVWIEPLRSGSPLLFFRAKISQDISVENVASEAQLSQRPKTQASFSSRAFLGSRGKIIFMDSDDSQKQACVHVQSYIP